MPSSLFLFQSTHAVLKAERLLLDAGISCKVIPVPKHISSECGICVLTPAGQSDAARAALDTARIAFQRQSYRE